MDNTEVNINKLDINSISRNHPITVIAGVAGFIGSYLADKLLAFDVQVIGIDNLSTGKLENISKLKKNKKFHFIKENIENIDIITGLIEIPKIDYAYFLIDPNSLSNNFNGLIKFLEYLKNNKEINDIKNRESTNKQELFYLDKPKILYVSSTTVYNNEENDNGINVYKDAENIFANYIKTNNLNGRIVRLAEVIGPMLPLNNNLPLCNLLVNVAEKQESVNLSYNETTNAIYIDDAITLLTKANLLGATKNKIFDGAKEEHIRLIELHRIALEIINNNDKDLHIHKTADIPTPNLMRTIKELSWNPKTETVVSLKNTIEYLKNIKEDNSEIKTKQEVGGWEYGESKEQLNKNEYNDEEIKKSVKNKENYNKKNKIALPFNITNYLIVFLILLIVYLLVYPMFNFLTGFVVLPQNLESISKSVKDKNYNKGYLLSNTSSKIVNNNDLIYSWIAIINKLGVLKNTTEKMINNHKNEKEVYSTLDKNLLTLKTFEELKKSQRLGHNVEYEKYTSNIDESIVTTQLLTTKLLSSENEFNSLPRKTVIDSLKNIFDGLVKNKIYSILISEAINSNKKYILIINNNQSINKDGGDVLSINFINIDKGKIVKLDQLPIENKLNFTNFDSKTLVDEINKVYKLNYDYDAIVSLDISSINSILDIVGEIKIGSDSIGSKNILDVVNWGNTNDKTKISEPLFINGYFEKLNKEWFGKDSLIVDAINNSLNSKHILIYSNNKYIQNFIYENNWYGDIPTSGGIGENVKLNDYLAVLEDSDVNNFNSQNLKKKYSLVTIINKDNIVNNELSLSLKNTDKNSTSYKGNISIILPLNTKVDKVLVSGVNQNDDITSQVKYNIFYNRSEFILPISLDANVQKDIKVTYQLPSEFKFTNKSATYNLKIYKQVGAENVPFDWQVNYPDNLEPIKHDDLKVDGNKLNYISQISKDRSFYIEFKSN